MFFWDMVNKQGPIIIESLGPCWEWMGYREKNGYGWSHFQGRAQGAHRIAWQRTHHKAIPEGLGVLHRCDNPPCVNPSHLFLGTDKDNAQDRNAKGRACPTRIWLRALSMSDAIQIRKQRASGRTFQSLADEYGVAVCCIQNIVANKTYI